MAHYFDETLHRHARGGVQTPRFRRSSTARSIGARSDFEGADDGEASSSVILGDPEKLRRKAEADAHMHHYISDQLERVRTARDAGSGDGEEFEAHA
jgi:hypothetical protein